MTSGLEPDALASIMYEAGARAGDDFEAGLNACAADLAVRDDAPISTARRIIAAHASQASRRSAARRGIDGSSGYYLVPAGHPFSFYLSIALIILMTFGGIYTGYKHEQAKRAYEMGVHEGYSQAVEERRERVEPAQAELDED